MNLQFVARRLGKLTAVLLAAALASFGLPCWESGSAFAVEGNVLGPDLIGVGEGYGYRKLPLTASGRRPRAARAQLLTVWFYGNALDYALTLGSSACGRDVEFSVSVGGGVPQVIQVPGRAAQRSRGSCVYSASVPLSWSDPGPRVADVTFQVRVGGSAGTLQSSQLALGVDRSDRFHEQLVGLPMPVRRLAQRAWTEGILRAHRGLASALTQAPSLPSRDRWILALQAIPGIRSNLEQFYVGAQAELLDRARFLRVPLRVEHEQQLAAAFAHGLELSHASLVVSAFHLVFPHTVSQQDAEGVPEPVISPDELKTLLQYIAQLIEYLTRVGAEKGTDVRWVWRREEWQIFVDDGDGADWTTRGLYHKDDSRVYVNVTRPKPKFYWIWPREGWDPYKQALRDDMRIYIIADPYLKGGVTVYDYGFSRPPTDEELQQILAIFERELASGRLTREDLYWIVYGSVELLQTVLHELEHSYSSRSDGKISEVLAMILADNDLNLYHIVRVNLEYLTRSSSGYTADDLASEFFARLLEGVAKAALDPAFDCRLINMEKWLPQEIESGEYGGIVWYPYWKIGQGLLDGRLPKFEEWLLAYYEGNGMTFTRQLYGIFKGYWRARRHGCNPSATPAPTPGQPSTPPPPPRSTPTQTPTPTPTPTAHPTPRLTPGPTPLQTPDSG